MAEREDGDLQNPYTPENLGSSSAKLNQLSPPTPLSTNQVFRLPENQGTQSSPESMERHSRSVTPTPYQSWPENHVGQSWPENRNPSIHRRRIVTDESLPENLPHTISFREYQPLHRRQSNHHPEFNPQPNTNGNYAILNPDIYNLGRDLDRLRLCTAPRPSSSLPAVANSSILPVLERRRIECAVRGLGHPFLNGSGQQRQLGHPINFNNVNAGRSYDHHDRPLGAGTRRRLNNPFQEVVNNGFGNCDPNPDAVGVGRRLNYPFEDANINGNQSYGVFSGNNANPNPSPVRSNSFSANNSGSNSFSINNYGGSNSFFINNGGNYGGLNAFSVNNGCGVLNTPTVNALNGFSSYSDGNHGELSAFPMNNGGLGVGRRQSFDGVNINGNVGVGGSGRGSNRVDVGAPILRPNRRDRAYSTSNHYHHHHHQLESGSSEKLRELTKKQLEEGNVEEMQVFFSANLKELMVDQLGNSYLHTFFQACNEDQLTQLLLSIVGDDRNLTNICLHSLGSRAMQALVEMLITPAQVSLLVSSLKNIAVTLCKSPAGQHVIKYCLKFFPHEGIKVYLLLSYICDP